MKVLVTGAAGYFGGAVLRALADEPRVEAVVATDVVAPAFTHEKIRFEARDLLGAGAADLVPGMDAVIHLAFTVERLPGQDPAALNVRAAERFLAAAVAEARVVVFASSVMAYGFRPAPGPPLREDEPAGPHHGFYYAEHKQAAEAALAALPGPARKVVLRPSAAVGPRLDARRGAMYRNKGAMVMPRSRFERLVQLVHEDDLGRAFVAALDLPAGVYNVAADDAMSTEAVAAMLGRRHVTLPMAVCAWAMDAMWRLGASRMDGSWVRTLAHPVQVVDNGKLKALGWTPRHTTRQAIEATFEGERI